METKLKYIIAVIVTGFMISCSPREISTKYYEQHKNTLDSIEEAYARLYKQKPFTVGFTNQDFETVTLEIITDSLTYIYDFYVTEKRLGDTLFKYGMDSLAIRGLVKEMRSIRCTWVYNFDYYLDGEKTSVVFLSIKPVEIRRPFSSKKYYNITYFQQKQYYDKQGRLVNNRRQRQLQRLNGDVFKRINDKVSYTVSSTYR